MPRIRLFLLSLALITATGGDRAGAVDDAPVDFDSQVRPILSDHCFQCHGPDEATRQAGLRLDSAQSVQADLGGYAAIVPGDPELSEAYLRISSDDPDTVMPPPQSKLSLSESQKQIIRSWIEQGANWSEHWAFVAPVSPEVPADPTGWARNPIDHFVRSRAVEAGLKPSPVASRETLIRRLSLDLTGLPPTPQQVADFLVDDSETAYEKVVDRLLQSPHYGERMAWPWLDAARYADTDGFQGDPTRSMWPWRDWLVDALNRNLPFDQFTIEMLAGDLLPGATSEQILASGFNRNHMFNGEGGRIPEETRVENVFDRTETTATVWLGLTMTCCRCHDHKFDPISQREYYSLYDFFNQTSETGRSGRGETPPVLSYRTPSVRSQLAELDEQIASLERELLAADPELDEAQSVWEAKWQAKLGEVRGETVLGPWWQLGPIAQPPKQAFKQDLGPEAKLDLSDTIGDQSWRMTPDLSDGQVLPLPDTLGATYFYRTIESPSQRSVKLSFGSDDAIKVWINGKLLLANEATRAAEADQELIDAELTKGINQLLVKIVNFGGQAGFYFKRVSENPFDLPAEVVAALRGPAAERTESQRQLLRRHYRSERLPELVGKLRRIGERKEKLAGQTIPVMVMDQLPETERRETFVLERGGYDKATETMVEAGTPSILPPLPEDAPRNRLTLARWLVDPANPLTARVTVNRYWQMFFGRGIVRSSEDFGVQGTPPTHPDLLDWLATEYVRSGWNTKAIHKLIVMSATYRQSAEVEPEALERDPENIWLARGPRFRMPSWMLRDQALAVSGLLSPVSGGPPIKPHQPDGVWAEATFGKIKYEPDRGEPVYRRSLYVFWRRIVGPTMFFDSAARQTCEVKPTRTNTPLHALTTLNEPAFVEAARGMAERVIRDHQQDQQRIRYAFRLVTARLPEPTEFSILTKRLDQLRDDFAAHPDQAEALLGVGQSSRDRQLDPIEHASYAVLCSLLLNLDETLTRP